MNNQSQGQSTVINQLLMFMFLFQFILFSGISVSAQYLTEPTSRAGLWFGINKVGFIGFENILKKSQFNLNQYYV